METNKKIQKSCPDCKKTQEKINNLIYEYELLKKNFEAWKKEHINDETNPLIDSHINNYDAFLKQLNNLKLKK